MVNQKPLRPSLKEKKRYLVYELLSDKEFSPDEVAKAISDSCLSFIGILHYGKAGVMVLKNQIIGNRGIIKVNHKYVDYVKASLVQMTSINGAKVSMDLKGVSGILKKARAKYMA